MVFYDGLQDISHEGGGSLRTSGRLQKVYGKNIKHHSLPSIIYRGYYMAARRYEIYLRVLKNISRVSAANE